MSPPGPGATFAGYHIEGTAGRGGMGIVYRARQLRPDRLVALKVIAPEYVEDPDFRERFERESNLAASIEHPNVIPVYEVDEAEGMLYIAMRFVDGSDFRELIRAGVDPARAVQVIEQMAAALDAAHARGLVHRDVKPGNILVSLEGHRPHAYLTDFGLTKRIAGSGDLTHSGAVVGTPDYMAPEQIQGEPVDARTDVYALACVLYHALTGQVPYPRDTQVATLFAHLSEPTPSLFAHRSRDDLPVAMENVIARGMAKERDQRYPSAGDLGRAVLAAFENRTVETPERTVAVGAAAPGGTSAVGPAGATAVAATRPRAQSPVAAGETTTSVLPGRRRRWQIAVAAVAVIGIVAAIGVVATGRDSDGDSATPAARVGTLVGKPIVLGGPPRAIAGGGRSVWVTNANDRTLTRIRVSGGGVRRKSARTGRGPAGVAVGEGSAWATNFLDGTVTRVDEATARVQDPAIRVGARPADVAVGHGSVWTANSADDTISRIDPSSGRVRTIRVGDGPWDIAIGSDAVWVANVDGDTLSRVNPVSNRVTGSEIPVGDRPESILVAAGAVWVGNISNDTVTRVDPQTNRTTSTIPVGNRPDALASAGGAVYVVNQDSDSLQRIDPSRRRVVGRALKVGNAPSDVAAADGMLWIANFQGENVVRVRPPPPAG